MEALGCWCGPWTSNAVLAKYATSVLSPLALRNLVITDNLLLSYLVTTSQLL